MPRYRKLILPCLLSLLLAGCNKPAGQTLLEDYLYRLGNSTETSIDTELDNLPPIAPYPPRRERLAETVELREGFLDTLNLGRCNLLPLIAERNSSLGKVMPVSQQLIYELRFYAAINQCRSLPDVREDTELRAQVEEIFRVKQQNLPAVFWNAVYNSAEMEANFALGETPLPPENNGTLGPSLKAMNHFTRLLEASQAADFSQPPVSLEQLESDYEALYKNRFGAQWLTSIRLMTITLERAADALEQRLAGRKLCPQGLPTPKAKILYNVFNNYYAVGVQRYLAQIDRSGKAWLKAHRQLIDALPAENRLTNYQQSVLSIEGELWQRYVQARDRHTQGWQRQLQQCNLMPGRP